MATMDSSFWWWNKDEWEPVYNWETHSVGGKSDTVRNGVTGRYTKCYGKHS